MKTCPKCGFENSNGHRFCMKCGNSLEEDLHPIDFSRIKPIPIYEEEANEEKDNFTLLRDNLTPAEGESEIRTYHCTSFKSALLNLKAEGHLVVTNKRVVFHAAGDSYAGKSILQSEVPIEDVSGISLYKGSYISFWHILGALVFSGIVGALLNGIVGAIIYSYIRSIMKNPLGASDAYQSAQTTIQVIMWLLALGTLVTSFLFARVSIFRPTSAVTSSLFFAELGGVSMLASLARNFLSSGTGSSNQWIMILAILVGIYAMVCVFWYARRPTMSLSVGSKGGSSTPIAISGVSNLGIYNTSASKALSAEPAEDAEDLLKELGAMIMDIQVLGDLGIQHWRSEAEDSPKPEAQRGM